VGGQVEQRDRLAGEVRRTQREYIVDRIGERDGAAIERAGEQHAGDRLGERAKLEDRIGARRRTADRGRAETCNDPQAGPHHRRDQTDRLAGHTCRIDVGFDQPGELSGERVLGGRRCAGPRVVLARGARSGDRARALPVATTRDEDSERTP